MSDRVRHALALGYLGDKSVPLTDVADMLGFSSQSSFIRAFKRWTNVSPGEYRRMKTQP
ncbi:MAG: AraC family transcriptional regulator [Aquabacterium sp.]